MILQASTSKIFGLYMNVLGHYKCALAQYVNAQTQLMTTSNE